MDITPFTTYHLIKSQDLNHHGTLYAGRCADWFVESGFIAACSLAKPEHIVCLKIHGLLFSKPAHLGDILCFESKVVLAGRTSLISHVQVIIDDQPVLDGFITFIYVDLQGKPQAHNISIIATKPEDITLQEKARQLQT